MQPDKTHCTLDDAAGRLSCSPRDLLHLAVQRKVTLLIGIPDRIEVRVFDGHTNTIYPPFLQQPDLLALSQSACLKIETTGKTAQSDFPEGYLLDSGGQLNRLLPSYGRPALQSPWTRWRTCRNGEAHLIEISREQLFVLQDELTRLVQHPPRVGSESDVATAAAAIDPEIEADEVTPQADTPHINTTKEVVPPKVFSATNKLLRITAVIERTGLSRSTIYDKMNPKSRRYDPSFPKKKRISENAVGWLESDLSIWISEKK